MRKLLFLVTAVAGLAVAAPAGAATKVVRITSMGFVPAQVTISAGDVVRWTNADTRNHQVVANNGTFASPILRPGARYSFRFNTAGRIGYRDALRPALRGVVVVKGPPPSVSIAASEPIVRYGTDVMLSGTISTRRAGEQVTILAQPYPQGSFVEVATVITTAGGAWDYMTTPEILTSYRARWNGRLSTTVTAGVQPRIGFGRYTRRVFAVKVTAARSFSGR